MPMPWDEAQPQILTSPDKKYQIMNHFRTHRDNFGTYGVEGVIKNISSEPEINAKIKIEFYGIDKVKIDSEDDNIAVLKPGGTRAFYIFYSGPRRGDIRYHKIYLS